MINIEFAHVYIDQHNDLVEHENAVNCLIREQKERSLKQESIVQGIWIDDYNPSDSILDVDLFIKKISENVNVDYICSEKKIASQYFHFRRYLDATDKRYYDEYLEKKGKLPCSLVTAMWYLARLNNDFIVDACLDDTKTDIFKSDQILNILPKKFANVEKTVKRLYKKNTKLKPFLNRIETKFF